MITSSAYYKGQREEIVAFLPSRYFTVLEIGCGEGRFRDNLDQKHEYWGVEPVESVARIAQRTLDKVFVGTYQELAEEIPNNYFDLVICNDVIEHMPDHDRFLQSIQEKLKRDGFLVGSVPNVRYIWNLWNLLVKKDWEYKDAGTLDRTHLRFFTKKSLTRSLVGNGFLIDQIAGITPFKPQVDLKGAVFALAVLLFGPDVKYVQYAFRVRVRRRESRSPASANER